MVLVTNVYYGGNAGVAFGCDGQYDDGNAGESGDNKDNDAKKMMITLIMMRIMMMMMEMTMRMRMIMTIMIVSQNSSSCFFQRLKIFQPGCKWHQIFACRVVIM